MINKNKLIIAIFILTVLIIGGYFAYSFLLQSTITQTPSPSSAPLTGPSQEVEGKLMTVNGQILTLEVGSDRVTFDLSSTQTFYKCDDFNDINTCTVNKDGLKKATLVKVLAKGRSALYIIYK